MEPRLRRRSTHRRTALDPYWARIPTKCQGGDSLTFDILDRAGRRSTHHRLLRSPRPAFPLAMDYMTTFNARLICEHIRHTGGGETLTTAGSLVEETHPPQVTAEPAARLPVGQARGGPESKRQRQTYLFSLAVLRRRSIPRRVVTKVPLGVHRVAVPIFKGTNGASSRSDRP